MIPSLLRCFRAGVSEIRTVGATEEISVLGVVGVWVGVSCGTVGCGEVYRGGFRAESYSEVFICIFFLRFSGFYQWKFGFFVRPREDKENVLV